MPHQNQGRVEHDRTDVEYRYPAKRHAQLKNIEIWSQYSKRTAFTSGEQYWTLMDDKSFELETVEAAKLIASRQQFHGINDNSQKYKKCMRRFCGVIGHLGELTAVLRRVHACPQGGIFYLDTMTQLDEKSAIASTMLSATLTACGPQTLVAANFCFTKPRKGHQEIDPGVFVDRLLAFTPEETQGKWALVATMENHDCFLPNKTKSTQMVTLFFWGAK